MKRQLKEGKRRRQVGNRDLKGRGRRDERTHHRMWIIPMRKLRSRLGRRLPKREGIEKKNQGEPEESSSSSSESSSESDEEDEEDNSEIVRGRSGRAPPVQLPFGPVPRKPIAGPSRNRYDPATGPQYEKPNTRRRGLNDGGENSPVKRRKIGGKEVVKVGPPRGVKKDKTMAVKDNAKK
jgi:hypothetical protein